MFADKKSEMVDAIKRCDKEENCNTCVKSYNMKCDSKIIITPCNYIRAKYKESIWDYKRGLI